MAGDTPNQAVGRKAQFFSSDGAGRRKRRVLNGSDWGEERTSLPRLSIMWSIVVSRSASDNEYLGEERRELESSKETVNGLYAFKKHGYANPHTFGVRRGGKGRTGGKELLTRKRGRSSCCTYVSTAAAQVPHVPSTVDSPRDLHPLPNTSKLEQQMSSRINCTNSYSSIKK
jgi:hypothetical protein